MRKKLMATCCALGTLCLAAGLGLSVQANVSADSVAPTVTLKDGASARLHATEYGIRFTGVIENYDEGYTYGMYIFPAEFLDDYTSGSVVEHAQSKLEAGKTLAGGDCKVYQNGEAYQINGALTGLNYNNLNREFVAIAYAKDGSGNYAYSDVSVSRNIVWVAGAALDDTTKTYNETQTNVLNDFIKLGYYQAVGTEETAAKAATELPAIEVGGATEVYNYLYVAPTPTFTYGGEAITNAFNPYASEVSDELTYWQKNVRSYQTGSYTLGYANITGTHTVTIRAFDETLDEAYFGIYETVKREEKVVFDAMNIACDPASELVLTTKGVVRGFAAGADYTVTDNGVSIPVARINYFGQLSDLVVYDGDTVSVYSVEPFASLLGSNYASKWTKGSNLFWGYNATAGVLLGPKYGGPRATQWTEEQNRGQQTQLIETSIDSLKQAYEDGYQKVSVDVTVNADFGAYTYPKGIRVYTTADTAVNVKTVTSGVSGVSVYKDYLTDVTAAGTYTVSINIKEILSLDTSAVRFGFVIAGPSANAVVSTTATHTVFFNNIRAEKATAEELKAQYGFSATTSYSTASGGLWDVNASGTFAKVWDATAKAMKITMANANSGLTGRDFVTYTDISILKDAYNAGFTMMSFKVSSPDGAFTGENRTVGSATVLNGIRVYSKQTPGRNGDGAGVVDSATYGTYVYQDFGTGGNVTEFEVEIDIAEFLALNANAKYFALVFSMPNGTTAYLSDLDFFTAAE